MNANPAPIPCALRNPSQASESQSPDASEDTPPSSLLPVEGKLSSLNGATGDRSPSQDGNEGHGEPEKQIPKVSLASLLSTRTLILRQFIMLHTNHLSLPRLNLLTPLRTLLSMFPRQGRVTPHHPMALQVVSLLVRMSMGAVEKRKSKY